MIIGKENKSEIFFMKDLLSIVIPCKNEENYIGYLFEDLLKQKNIQDVRIIVADADSSDNTIFIIKNYAKFLNIEIIKGGNVSEGRNNGASLVSTPFILFLDSDVRFFNSYAISDTLTYMMNKNLDLMTLNIKNYGNDLLASFLFFVFNIINNFMTRKTPFAIGAFFLTRKDTFERLGRFPNKYETSEDYILSKSYPASSFRIGKHYFGQDERRFKKLGYIGMLKYMIINFLNRNNLKHFEKSKVNYWN
jgi:glycosyltransferase involved in cell wall biosynthesis